MLFEDTYKTIATPTQGIYRDKGSKFLAYAYPFRKEKDLKDIVAQLRSEHSKARHHCWAYRIGTDRNNFRLNDDGEPSGTAGRPILNSLLSADLTNILVIVVRYFGGTLLGVPGLINAYKTATVEALAAAEIIESTVNDVYQMEFDYLIMNDVMRVIKDHQISILEQHFDLRCKIIFELRKSALNTILPKLESLETKLTYLYTQ